MNGRFIVLEGPEGAGKSTVLQELVRALQAGSPGLEVVCTREPGGTPLGDAIREVLLDPDHTVSPLAEYLLYSASRAQHVEEVIRPALDRGALVVSDRFFASSVAYQGAGRGVEAAFIDDLNARVAGGLMPDLTILLDLPAEEGLRRIRARGAADRLERLNGSFHERVAESFRRQAAAGGWLTVNAARPPGEVAADVLRAVQGILAC